MSLVPQDEDRNLVVTKKRKRRKRGRQRQRERDANVGEIDKEREREIPTLPVANDQTLSIFNILGKITIYPSVV